MAVLEIGLRADASLDIGTGHVMRCLTLADELKRGGANCRFICREHRGHLIELIRARGFEVLNLPSTGRPKADAPRGKDDYAAWLGVDQSTDAAQTLEALGERRFDILVVDHYGLDACWERLMRPSARRILAIDDLANRRHDCELLLDQNLGRRAEDYAELLPATSTLLLGPRYALLRPEFASWRTRSLERRSSPQVKQLLVTLGGIDKDNITLSVLKALTGTALPENCNVVAVMGGGAPGVQAVHDFVRCTSARMELRVDESNMAALMAASDAAIGAAGGTAWERCCLGLPTLVISMAENQREGAMALQASGAALLIDGNLQLAQELPARLPELLDPQRLAQMCAACIAMVDGHGTRRVVEELLHVGF